MNNDFLLISAFRSGLPHLAELLCCARGEAVEHADFCSAASDCRPAAGHSDAGKEWRSAHKSTPGWIECSCLNVQGEKLSSTLVFAALQVAVGLLLGIHLPSDLAEVAIFLPNSR